MFSELGNLLEPRWRNMSPQLLAVIQCNRRWTRAEFGASEVPVKDSITTRRWTRNTVYISGIVVEKLTTKNLYSPS
jgi:hypothetical protein